MKRLIKRKLNTPPVGGVDPVLGGLLGVGLVSATGGYILATSKTPDPTVPENIEAETPTVELPPLLDLLPADRLPFTPPSPSLAPDSADAAQNLSPTRPYAADAVPQLAWQVNDDMGGQSATPQNGGPLAMLPGPPPAWQADFYDGAVSPPRDEASEQGEEEMDDDELNTRPTEGQNQAPGEDTNLPALDDILSGSGGSDALFGGGFEAPSPQELNNWETLFGPVTVPQSRYLSLDPIILQREVSTERKLVDIIFGDPVLDAAGVIMDSHPALEIRNRNELWLRDGIDFTDPYYVPQTYLRFYALADPSSFASTVVYVMDAPPPGETNNPEDGNQNYDNTQDEGANGNGNANSNGNPQYEQANPNTNQQPYYDESAMNEQEDFGDMSFEYHQNPDII